MTDTNNPAPPEALQPDEITAITQPYYNQLDKQGAMRDNDVIADKDLAKLQRPVIADANAAVNFRLMQEQYRRLWEYKDRYRLDNWAHKDKVKQMKRTRKAQCNKAKAALKTEKQQLAKQRNALNAIRKQARKQEKLACKKAKLKPEPLPLLPPK